MKPIPYQERVRLIKIVREMIENLHNLTKLADLQISALRIAHENEQDVDDYILREDSVSIHKLDESLHRLNAMVGEQMRIEEKLLSASRKLLTDFAGAEQDAHDAIYLLFDDKKDKSNNYTSERDEFIRMENAVKSWMSSPEALDIKRRRDLGEKVSDPPRIQEMKNKIKDAKSLVNSIANYMMVTSPEFRDNREQYIKQSLEGPEYNARFKDRDGQIQYRTIRPEGDYGKPAVAFKEGLAPQFISIWAFQEGIISKPYVNDAFKMTGEKVGWSGGIVSTSANIKFCAAFDFAASYGMQDGLIYAYACGEAASVARHINFGAGYDGKVDPTQKVDRSNAEAAMEYMLPYLAPERIVGAREVFKDGRLGQFFPNPNATKSAFGDVEYLKLMLCESVNELKIIEYLERRSVEVIHGDSLVQHTTEMIKAFSELTPQRQAVVLKLAHASNIALHKGLVENIMPGLEKTDPEKYRLLQSLKYSDDPERPIQIFMEMMSLTLPRDQFLKLKEQVKKESSVRVDSHFSLEFESDKRTARARQHSDNAERQPSTRFFRRPTQQVDPVRTDELNDISQVKPKGPAGGSDR